MLQPLFDQVGQVLLIAPEGAGHECPAGGQGQRDGIDGSLDAAEGRAFAKVLHELANRV